MAENNPKQGPMRDVQQPAIPQPTTAHDRRREMMRHAAAGGQRKPVEIEINPQNTADPTGLGTSHPDNAERNEANRKANEEARTANTDRLKKAGRLREATGEPADKPKRTTKKEGDRAVQEGG